MDKTPSLPNHAGNSILGTQTHSDGASLMRYHSAPSSVLASLLPSEDFLHSTTTHVEDSELARICMPSAPSNVQIAAENAHGCIRAYNRHVPPSLSKAPVNTGASFPHHGADSNESPTSGHLCSIFKRTQIDPFAKLQSSVQNADNSITPELLPIHTMPARLSSLSQPFISTKSNLIRHSSFPAEILSQLGIQESNDQGPMQRFTGASTPRDGVKASTAAESIHYDKVRLTHVEADILNENMRVPHIVRDSSRDAHVSHATTGNTQFALRSTGWLESNRPHLAKGSSFNGKSTAFQPNAKIKVSGAETQSTEPSLCVNQSSLFRHSSLPSSLLSQLSVDGTCDRVSMPTSSGNSSEEGGSRYTSRVSGFWDEAGAGTVSPGQRKRGREVEDKAIDRLSALDSIQACSIEEEILQWSFGPLTETSSGSLLSSDDSVLCRARAKRGCATHPRSIAERVRRTKISEGMRKLQELVPNLEKQTNTATMLDEAVEYVKFLQQQIQKLTESQAKCKGMCRSKSNI